MKVHWRLDFSFPGYKGLLDNKGLPGNKDLSENKDLPGNKCLFNRALIEVRGEKTSLCYSRVSCDRGLRSCKIFNCDVKGVRGSETGNNILGDRVWCTTLLNMTQCYLFAFPLDHCSWRRFFDIFLSINQPLTVTFKNIQIFHNIFQRLLQLEYH